ncbi:MAG TPA: class I SAM-dependent methyltransferase [Acidobacteriota bacterium]|nr:class I SAM-dependent methyltransferase [Acidobacteriota bacterium]
MRRLHLLEIEDQRWCPVSIRDAITDLLQFALNLGNNYACVVPRLRRALERTGTRRIIDLCSGAGGPWLGILRAFEENEKFQIQVCLTDRYPNIAGLQRIQKASNNKINYRKDSIDATNIPAELKGFRTLFTSFHHFRPKDAKKILRNAVQNRQGIGVFEVARRHPLALLGLLLLTPSIFLITPFIRPFRWSRLLWTYLIPVVPIITLFDGVVSCLRAYTPAELRQFTEELAGSRYMWEIGEESSYSGLPLVPITYLIGYSIQDQVGE